MDAIADATICSTIMSYLCILIALLIYRCMVNSAQFRFVFTLQVH